MPCVWRLSLDYPIAKVEKRKYHKLVTATNLSVVSSIYTPKLTDKKIGNSIGERNIRVSALKRTMGSAIRELSLLHCE